MSKPTFKILYFATASTFTKKSSELLPAPLPLNELFGVLEGMYPGFRKKVLESCAVVVNMEYVDVDGGDEGKEGEGEKKGLVIQQGDEVGIIPPVSSG